MFNQSPRRYRYDWFWFSSGKCCDESCVQGFFLIMISKTEIFSQSTILFRQQVSKKHSVKSISKQIVRLKFVRLNISVIWFDSKVSSYWSHKMLHIFVWLQMDAEDVHQLILIKIHLLWTHFYVQNQFTIGKNRFFLFVWENFF